MQKLYSLVCAATVLSGLASAQTPGEKQIIQELRKIRQLLEAPVDQPPAQAPAPTHLKVSIKDLPSQGSDNAPVTIVEFNDLQCPFCNQFHTKTLPDIKKNLIDTSKVRFVNWDLPLDIHANAALAANAGRCAGDQGRYWDLRDWMGANPTNLGLDDLVAQSISMNLDTQTFRSCLATGKYQEAVQKQANEAVKMGVRATPSFLIGKTGETVEGELLQGALPYAQFEAKVKSLLQ